MYRTNVQDEDPRLPRRAFVDFGVDHCDFLEKRFCGFPMVLCHGQIDAFAMRARRQHSLRLALEDHLGQEIARLGAAHEGHRDVAVVVAQSFGRSTLLAPPLVVSWHKLGGSLV